MTQNELAALMIGLMVFAFIFALGMDTNPLSGRKFTPLARRAFNRLGDGLEILFGKDGI